MSDGELLVSCVIFGGVLAMLVGSWIFDTPRGGR